MRAEEEGCRNKRDAESVGKRCGHSSSSPLVTVSIIIVVGGTTIGPLWNLEHSTFTSKTRDAKNANGMERE